MLVNEQPTLRQQREIEYHEEHAAQRAHVADEAVPFDVIRDSKRRWWNAYWSLYDVVLKHDLRGKRVLIPGCGFCEDAIRLAELGADVYAFDISQAIVDVSKARVRKLGYTNVDLRVQPSERLEYEDGFFDYVFFMDILHHVDIPATMTEVARVLKPGAYVLGGELYTHSFLQRNIRESWLVRKVLYPRMHDFVYGGKESYITEDEHKIDEDEFSYVTRICDTVHVRYYNMLAGRLFGVRNRTLSKLDRILTKMTGPLGRVFAGRIVFEGRTPTA